jgi:cell wall-associated NlpC family hydrolase
MVFSQQPAASPAAEDVLFRAMGLVGTPYRWGGNTGFGVRLQRPDRLRVP